ncbi:putative linoleate 9s-lipoxygenase 5 [Quercus suber]|uniref:Lipoxygenase n=1 Tax=Quercus suber TaxID=58331 RepID=A0AAW0KVP7_QUESU
MLQNIINKITGDDESRNKKVEGTVVLMKKNVLDFNDFYASILDGFLELLGQKVSFQLISAVNGDPDVPGQGRVHFVCNSWVYPADKYGKDRTYLPSDTPVPLLKYRENELVNLRGDGKGELQEWERVYDYAYYNDLGDPDKNAKYARPVLGGSSEYPYPRRGRTGRPPTKTDPNTESRLELLMSLNIYVPRDERFGHLKLSDFLAYALKSVGQFLKPELESLFDSTPSEFDSFKDVLKLYEGGIKLPDGLLKTIRDNIPAELLKEVFPTDEDRSAWRTDEEFAREMLAGVNPVDISRLKALEKNKLFILDHHDAILPYLRRINSTTTKTYASRTLLFLKNDGALKPLVIELSLPHPEETNMVPLAKCTHQLNKALKVPFGNWQKLMLLLNTHAVIEPFVIATNRQLSVLHPIYKLLHPHFRDTMNINAFARQILINGGGILETTVFPAKYSMEMSSVVYKDWVFPEQALPADLLKRGMAVKDPNSPHGLRLVIEDYPYAVDGLEIWSAINSWVKDYCSFYYETDSVVQKDAELQSWWKELREQAMVTRKMSPGGLKCRHAKSLLKHALSLYGLLLHSMQRLTLDSYLPNRPTISRRFMPEEGTPEYDELKSDPDNVYLKTITAQLQTLLGVALIEILSRHSTDEVYLGQRDSREWTFDTEPLEAFDRFGKKLAEIEDRIVTMNNDKKWKTELDQ